MTYLNCKIGFTCFDQITLLQEFLKSSIGLENPETIPIGQKSYSWNPD